MRTGHTLWSKQGIIGQLTYDEGRVFALASSGVVGAYSASTGRLLWQRRASSDVYSEPPVATGGTLYTISSNRSILTAIDERTGAARWRVTTKGEYGTSISVDSGQVYVDSCEQMAAYARSDGRLIWRRPESCFVPPFGPARFGNYILANNGTQLLSAASGRHVATLPQSQLAPIVAGSFVIATPPTSTTTVALESVQAQTGALRWRHTSPLSYGQPLSVGRDLFVLQGSSLSTFDAATGAMRGSAAVPGSSSTQQGLLPTMSSAEGYLLVPQNSDLNAYVGLYDPPSDGVETGVQPSITVWGAHHRVRLEGRLGSSFRKQGSTHIVLDRAEWPSRRLHPIARGKSFADGTFRLYSKPPSRNTLYAVVPAHRQAKVSAAELFVYPKAHFHFAYQRSTRKIRATVSLRFDPRIRLNGHTGFLYLNRVNEKKLVALGHGTIKGSHGRARLIVTFPALKRVAKNDTILWCTHEMTKLGLGYPDIVNARCGRSTISYG